MCYYGSLGSQVSRIQKNPTICFQLTVRDLKQKKLKEYFWKKKQLKLIHNGLKMKVNDKIVNIVYSNLCKTYLSSYCA